MDFTEIDKYLRRVIPARPQTMQGMERFAAQNNFPIIGPLVGRYLYQTALVHQAKNILEFGSGFGYSAYWFSLAIGRQGKIIMTDGNEQNKTRALAYFKKGKLKSKFDFRVGDALEIATGLKSKFDIILNDIDKQDYPETIDQAARLLRPGGVFITDNLIWSGKVFNSKIRDKATCGVREFTRRLYADKRFFTTILPLRDGIAVALKK